MDMSSIPLKFDAYKHNINTCLHFGSMIVTDFFHGELFGPAAEVVPDGFRNLHLFQALEKEV